MTMCYLERWNYDPNTACQLLGGGNSSLFEKMHPDPWGYDPIWWAYFFQMGGTHQLPLDPKTMKKEGFKPPIYGL